MISLRGGATAEDVTAYQAKPQFSVSVSKLAVMSFFTFGVYQFFWFYKQWQAVRDREGDAISPFWRTFFTPIWAFGLFPAVEELAFRHGIRASWSPTVLGISFLALNATWLIPAPYSLVSVFAFFPLLLIQRTVNEINAAVAPETPQNDKYSGANMVGIVVGALCLLLIVYGTFFLPESLDVAS